jgi:hypothetical protein
MIDQITATFEKKRIYLFIFNKWLYTNMSSAIGVSEACLVRVLAQKVDDFDRAIESGLNIIFPFN